MDARDAIDTVIAGVGALCALAGVVFDCGALGMGAGAAVMVIGTLINRGRM